MIPTHTKKPTPVVAYKFEGLTPGSADYIDIVIYDSSNTICDKCNHHFDDHGLIHTNSGNALVCPGNYIVNNPDFPDDFYPVSAEIFENTYDEIVNSNSSEDKCCVSSNSINASSYNCEQQIKDEQKLKACTLLLEYTSDNTKAIKYLESLLSEQEVSKWVKLESKKDQEL